MRTVDQISGILPALEHSIADSFEDQDLDFKQWDESSIDDAIDLVVKMAICMANGGGGTVVFGIADKVIGRTMAIKGVPLSIDINRLKLAVYDETDPKITPEFQDLFVPEGTGRLLLMQIHPGMPPYTDTKGRGTIRVGKDCKPLTGTMRRKISAETGETDYSAEVIPGDAISKISPSAMERLRQIARAEHAPEDLLHLSDVELLSSLGVVSSGSLTRAGLILGGTEEAIRAHIPGYVWTFLHMRTDTDYDVRVDQTTAIPPSILRIEELITPYNTVDTTQDGMHEYEYPIYPTRAIREVLMNAFCHADFRRAGPIMVKVFQTRVEISNHGGFIGGITPDNILHHTPTPRNHLLVAALIKLHLVNRSSLGIPRIFSAFLMEGKEPPIIEESGESVRVIFRAQMISPYMRSYIAERSPDERVFSVDDLLLIHHLLRHQEIDTAGASHLCQRSEGDVKEILNTLESERIVQRRGTGKGTYWSLSPALSRRLSESGPTEHKRRIDWEVAKTRVLSILKEREEQGMEGLSNQDIRQITLFDRHQVFRLMNELRQENPEISEPGKGKGARYEYHSQEGNADPHAQ